MAFQKTARKDSAFRIVCILPDFCFLPTPPTPPQAPPIPFPLTTDLGKAKSVARDVLINKKPAFVFDASYAPKTFGDEPADPKVPAGGLRKKGILSHTAGEAAWPFTHSSSVKIRNHYIVRTGDMFHMNNKYKGRLKKKCPACKASVLAGLPVNPILGIKVLTDETDFAFSGILPLVWNRSYFSDQPGTGWLGNGWSVPGCRRIVRSADGMTYIDEQGRCLPLPNLDDGGPVLNEAEMLWFARDGAHYFVTALDGSLSLRFVPASVSDDDPEGADCPLFVLAAIEDGNGNCQRWLYHPATGLPQFVVDGNGRVFHLQFGNVASAAEPMMRLTAVSLLDALPPFGSTPPRGRVLVRYEYSATGDLLRVFGRDGNLSRSFTYRNHIMLSHTDAAGLVSSYEYDRYDAEGRVLLNTVSDGRQWRFDYHDGHTDVTDVLGRTERYRFDGNNELIGRTFADGSETSMERDRLGRLTAYTDALGRTTYYQYSREGQLTDITRPDGVTLHREYDDDYRLIIASDAEGNTDNYGYDDTGNLIRHTDTVGGVTRFSYLGNGLLETVTDPEGHTVSYRYGTDNLPEAVTDCSGYETRFEYNEDGLPLRITDAEGGRTEYHYDAALRPVAARYADGSNETFAYDAAGRLVRHTDAAGHATGYEYGPDGLPLQRTNALGHTFRYHYDTARRLVRLTNENGAHYRFAYGLLDELAAECGFDGKLTGYRYNAAGELTEQLEYGRVEEERAAALLARDGGEISDGPAPLRTAAFDRDSLGRLTRSLLRQDGGEWETRFGYDAEGRLVRAADANGITCFDYDVLGRTIQEAFRPHRPEADRDEALPETDWQNPDHDLILLHKFRNVRYRYDGNGNRTAVELPGGSGLENLYYGSGHLHRIAFDGETVTDIERDRLHRETGRTQGRLASRYTLDPLGRLKSQLAVPAGPSESKGKAAVTAAVKRSYGYDRTGNLTQSTDPRTGTTQFEYDKLGRITRAGDELFAFDPAHNIVDIPARPSENLPEGISAAADKAHTATVKDNRIKTYDGAEYYYDTFGNLTFMSLPDGSSRTLSYDLKDRLVLAEIWREGGKEIWRYEYDALDRRIAKEQVEVGEEHRPAADEKGRLKTVPGSRIEFVWDGSHLLQEIHPHGSYTYVYTDQDSYEPLAQICEWEDEAGETRRQVNYFHCDQIGLPREMTDGEGRLLWFGNYGGWGKLTEETNIANAHQPFRLQNQYCDGETGLHYNFFRYYDPHSGRFVTQDPVKLWGGANLYLFAPSICQWSDVLGLAKSKGARATITCNKGGSVSEYKGLSKNAARRAGREQNINKKITDLYEQKAREDRNPNINGTCAEAEALSNLMEKEGIKDIKGLMDFIKENKCRSEAFDMATDEPKAPCPKHCEPVLTFLGVAF